MVRAAALAISRTTAIVWAQRAQKEGVGTTKQPENDATPSQRRPQPPERLRDGGRRAGTSSRGFPGLVTLRQKSGPFVTPVTLCGLFLFPAVSTAKQKQAGEERGKQRDGARQGTCRRECGRRRACAPKILGLSGALVSIFVGSGPRGAKGGKVVEAGLSIVWKRGSKRRRSGDHDQRRSLRHAGKAAERRALWRRGKKDS